MANDKLMNLPKRIWYAGLGALSRAEKEGEEWLDDLVEEGQFYESEQKDKMEDVFDQLKTRLGEEAENVGRKMDNIEKTFERKVSETLSRLGLASRSEYDELQRKMADLQEELKNMKSKETSE